MQRCREIAVADFEHRQHAEEANLIEDVAARPRDRQAADQCRPRGIAFAVQVHRGDTQGDLQVHLLGPADRFVVERTDRQLRPGVAFRKQRHGEKRRRGDRGEFDPERDAAASTETPFQRRPHIVDVRGRDRRISGPGFARAQQVAIIRGMPACEFLQFSALR